MISNFAFFQVKNVKTIKSYLLVTIASFVALMIKIKISLRNHCLHILVRKYFIDHVWMSTVEGTE